MTLAAQQLISLTAKDLRIEVRGRQTIGLVIVLGALIIVVLGLGIGPEQLHSGFAAPSVLWVAYLFSGVMCFEKTMSIERQDGAMDAILLAPVDRGIIFLAKLLTNLVFMFVLAAVITPVAVILFGFNLSAAPGEFALVMALSMIGFAAVGTLFAAAVSSTRLQGGLLATLVFPLSLPLVIASTRILMQLFRDGEALTLSALTVLIAFDVIFLAVSWVVYELVLEP